MAVYSLTYDLNKNKDYTKLHQKIKLLANDIWCRPTLSQWLFYSDKNANYLMQQLRLACDSDDTLFLIEVNIQELRWDCFNVNAESVNWIKSFE